MKYRVLALSLAFMASQSASAAKLYIGVVPNGSQVERYESGVRAIASSMNKSSVRFVPSETPVKKRGEIQLVIMNHDKAPFNFGPENVHATLVDGTVVPIITYDQLRKEEKKRQTWAAVAAGLGAMSNAMSAANAGHYSGRSYSYGRVGSTSYSGSTHFSGYNAGVANIAHANASMQNQMMFSQLSQNNAARMNALKENIRTTTIDPEDLTGGAIVFEIPKANRSAKGQIPMKFTVEAGGEIHTFDVTLTAK
jgi:hypothetical protein